ncbi:MAG: precorrin-6A/cobalt-precorrin-6A reductase, partial [Streptomycetaceae bacterium]|nr:precorrin-6A/cobalt-precorrin-6A reductase [Streptomycetaceae bacterium]
GDDWRPVASVEEAARVLPGIARRVFLTTGRMETAPYAALDDLWFLLRSVEPPDGPVPKNLELVLARGPFTVADEIALMRRHAVDAVVTKDSGGTQTAAKLDAARELGLPVVVIARPAVTAGHCVASVREAVDWVATELGE